MKLSPLVMREDVIAADGEYGRVELAQLCKRVAQGADLFRAAARPVRWIKSQDDILAFHRRERHALFRLKVNLLLRGIGQSEVRCSVADFWRIRRIASFLIIRVHARRKV